MDGSKRIQHPWLLTGTGLVILLIVIGLEFLAPYGRAVDFLIRGTAMFAYLTIFLAILMTNFLKEIVRFFGVPFIRIHHLVTVTALLLILAHPLLVAWREGDLSVFVPATTSWYEFFALGGRAAWYLFMIASLAVVLRRGLTKSWRFIHGLSYLAFFLISIHGMLLGSNFQSLPVRIVVVLMMVTILAVFVLKRISRSKRGKRRASD